MPRSNTVIACAVAMVAVASTAGCASGAKPGSQLGVAAPTPATSPGTTAPPTTAASATPSPTPAPLPALTTDQLHSTLLTDLPGYQVDISADLAQNNGPRTQAEVVTLGGDGCQNFVDAVDALAAKHGTVAEAGGEYDNTAKHWTVLVDLRSFDTTGKAAAAVAAVKAAVPACPAYTATDPADKSTDPGDTHVNSGKDIAPTPDSADGDSSADYTMLIIQSGFQSKLNVQTIQVGSAVLTLAGILPHDASAAQAATQSVDVKTIRTEEVAKLRALLKG